MTESRVEIIEKLCNAYGVSGQEAEVRKLYEGYLNEVVDELEHDNFGGVVGKKVGDAAGPKILIAGHLDEIGMMVTYITDEGFVYFQTVGGWWSQVMLAQRVVIQTRKGLITGVIGSKPPHVLPREERDKVVKMTDMFIDIGVTSKKQAEEVGIRPGDPILPWSPFVQLADPKFYMGKALDNRLGCATALEVLRELKGASHPNVLFAGATTQEEVGLRGAQTMVQHVQPDIAIALDVGIAGDTPGMKKSEALSKCGDGPILLLYDSSMLPNPKFRDFVMDTAEDAGIPLQVEVVAGGGTDAGRFQYFGSGTPSLAIGYPTRYIHSHAAVYNQDDFDNGVRLLTEVVKRLSWDVVRDIQRH